eukprot:CAMPEP_0181046476 /NCGR_PEP_ID=MMETSP1070-20121207/14371_1 /TAXON_ID=265543 /ORGANISM="Minutocellus polymorphus, Strain NH13" /LENGTH=312 /DNA_ID=CAMNT_0023125093 /DNA_START=1 /DNA_END=939 /DNA_ORIENTATION=+
MASFQWFLGMCTASVFSLVYLVAPTYVLTAILSLLFQYPTRHAALLYAAPMLMSAAIPSFGAPWMAPILKPMLSYFDYHEEFEYSDDELRRDAKNGKRYIISVQPHGVISFVGLCSWVRAPSDFRRINTAVARVLLAFPILKHVMGIFGLTDASAGNIKRILKKSGVEGSVVLYCGGIAELFKSCLEEERLYLSKRKGFIKIALREGADILPCFMFGNTVVLSVLKHGPLASLSRKLGASVTYMWGKFYLPIPRDEMLMYVRGKPLGLPHIPEPTAEDIDKYHALYCKEVRRLFESYKEKLPHYKHKQLFID